MLEPVCSDRALLQPWLRRRCTGAAAPGNGYAAITHRWSLWRIAILAAFEPHTNVLGQHPGSISQVVEGKGFASDPSLLLLPRPLRRRALTLLARCRDILLGAGEQGVALDQVAHLAVELGVADDTGDAGLLSRAE